eukprot:m.66407 g.66407  ORF g.66407 m.66407 type:complete len:190 (-) comp23686_c0_seq1:99-668(-)
MSGLSFPQHLASGGFLPHPTPDNAPPGTESVWAPPFTRPPTTREVTGINVVVRVGPKDDSPILVTSTVAKQVLETSHPPTWYFPRESVNMKLLRCLHSDSTFCEFKGSAVYYDVLAGEGSSDVVSHNAAWTYPNTNAPIKGMIAIYLRNGITATVDGDTAKPQEGDFYGGWITRNVVGPFKGGPGTRMW